MGGYVIDETARLATAALCLEKCILTSSAESLAELVETVKEAWGAEETVRVIILALTEMEKKGGGRNIPPDNLAIARKFLRDNAAPFYKRSGNGKGKKPS